MGPLVAAGLLLACSVPVAAQPQTADRPNAGKVTTSPDCHLAGLAAPSSKLRPATAREIRAAFEGHKVSGMFWDGPNEFVLPSGSAVEYLPGGALIEHTEHGEVAGRYSVADGRLDQMFVFRDERGVFFWGVRVDGSDAHDVPFTCPG